MPFGDTALEWKTIAQIRNHNPKSHTHSKVVDILVVGSPSDNQILKYNLATGELNWEDDLTGGGNGGGDMLKSTYDQNTNDIVDNSEKLEGSTKVQVQDHNPKSHNHIESEITDLDHYDNADLRTEHPLLTGVNLHNPKSHNHIESEITDLDHYDSADFNTDHSGLSGECPQTPKSHNHVESDITDLEHDALKIQTILVAGSPSDNQILKYDLGTGELHWENDLTSGGGGGADVKSGALIVGGKVWTRVTFNTPFASIPAVAGAVGLNAAWSIRNVSVNDFEFYINSAGAGKQFYWIASDGGNP